MSKGIWAATLLLPWTLAAQMQLFVVRQGVEQPAGQSYEVGTVFSGAILDTAFRLRNSSLSPAGLYGLNVAGRGFTFASLPELSLQMAAGGAVDFAVRFQPPEAGAYIAYLNINGVRTTLSGTAIPAPKPPKPEISIQPQALRGGQQGEVTVRLAEVSRVSASGELSIELRPTAPGKAEDPAVLFPATGTRRIAFTVSEGEEVARFGGVPETEFQSGTTAGSLVFTAQLGPYSEELTAVVPSAPVVVDGAVSTRVAAGIEVQVTGFDTSRSASLLSFTFFDLEGRIVAPGPMQADASRAFQDYFGRTEFGSMFTLRAVFPVYGNSSRIAGVDVVLSNALGNTRTGHVSIQ
jgi:hypothetical protein